jgi:hypothetical protein
LTDVAHELGTLRITVDCDVLKSVNRKGAREKKKRRTSCAPRRLSVLKARLAGVFRVIRTAELVRVATLDTTAVFEEGVGPAERRGEEEKEGPSNLERRNGRRGDGRDEVVDPDSPVKEKGGLVAVEGEKQKKRNARRFCKIRALRPLPLRLQHIRKRVLIARREPSTNLLDVLQCGDVQVRGDEIDRGTDIEVGVNGVEVGD